jgi:transcriptional regulator with PAS, ATPase and Fis domain
MRQVTSELKEICETVQHVVSAMSAALGVDVAIIDINFELVATSKTFLETRGTDLNKNFIRGVYRKGTLVIPNPGHHELCQGCRYEGNCPETAEILQVIEKGGIRYGVLLMVAYTQAQKERFLNNISELLEFISEMANLIYDEIRLQQSLEKEKITQQHLKATINFMDNGVITIDRQGLITQINNQARDILQLGDRHVEQQPLKNFLPKQIITQLIEERRPVRRCEFQTAKPYKIHCLLSANPIVVSNRVMGAVLRIQDFKELRRAVYEFSAKYIETTFNDILGASDALLKVKAQASTAAHNDSTVLILGESGTGKELFARAIHTNSQRNVYPFIAINCAAIPENLLESELFGYDEGAFSGARKGGKPGKFEMADGGTIFLDEIGDMPLHMQAKILRILQEKVVERVGGIEVISVNVRIIAATNTQLEELMREERFRKDLYYRLNVFPISIPPLRVRRQDVTILAKHFLAKYNVKMERHLESFSPEALEMLVSYHWPGNVRELQNIVEYAVNVETGSVIRPSSFPASITRYGAAPPPRSSLGDKVREYEKMIIREVLESCDDSVEGKKRAAGELHISLPTLYRKIKALNL